MTSKLITPTVFSRTILLAVFALAVLILTSRGQSPGAAAQGNDPPNRVIWLHYDYMVKEGADAHSHEPQLESIRMVVEAFRNHGITLHIDPQHTALPESPFLSVGEHNCAESVNFFDLKAQYFHPRGNHLWHYAIFGHDMDYNFVCGLAATGVAEIGGYNFIVTLGQFLSFIPPDFLPWIEGGTFMHELGHNLGMLHGGVENHNWKPNYFSVMNYDYAYGIRSAASPGSTVEVSRRLDYSDRALPTLDENHLDENVGVSADSNDIVNYICLPPGHSEPDYVGGQGPGTGPIDWNCNGLIESDTQADVDLYEGHYFTLLTGYDDWAYVHAYLNTPRYRNGIVRQNPEVISCGHNRKRLDDALTTGAPFGRSK